MLGFIKGEWGGGGGGGAFPPPFTGAPPLEMSSRSLSLACLMIQSLTTFIRCERLVSLAVLDN